MSAAALITGCSSSSSNGSATSAPPTNPAPTTVTAAPRVYRARVTRETVVDPAYRQGLARTATGWIFSVNDGLFRTDDALKQTLAVTPAIPASWKAKGYNHIGDIDVANGLVYAPLEQPKYSLGHQAMLTYGATTLRYRGGLEVAQHEASFVTVDPARDIAYSMDRFGGDALLRYDVRHHWQRLAPLRMSRRVEKVQGADVVNGAAWLSTDDATDGVYRVDLQTGDVQALGSIGHVDGEGEGIDATPTAGGDLHVLSIDVKVVPVRLIDLTVSTSR